MPMASQGTAAPEDSEGYDVKAVGPVLQFIPAPSPAVPATINAASSYLSAVTPSEGYKAIAVGVTLSQTGNLKISRFLDLAGNVPLDVTTVALVAATANAVAVNDGKAFASYQITIQNTAGSTANVSNFGAILNAA